MTTTISTSRPSSSSDDVRTVTFARRDGGDVRVRCSVRADGDFHRIAVPYDELETRRRAFVDLPWTMLDERHGVVARDVRRPGQYDGAEGDIAITRRDDAVLGCWVGDCAPVVLIGVDRAVAVVHAGWRGLAAGVIDIAADGLGEAIASIVLGPTIGPCCYEFGRDDLAAVAAGVGTTPATISGRTVHGTLALDVEAAVRSVVSRHTHSVVVLGGCTGCTYPGFSHRARGERQRHVVAAWRTPGYAS
jgi:copper oxidase (laccase) domain-containing protein